ncbi:MAG: flavin reductase family protein [Silicimonas sp.]|nr:flavin reductase family protein [Silicimonas sp.]
MDIQSICPVQFDANALATLERDVKQMIPCGDHHIAFGSVRAIDGREGDPLVFFRGQFTTLGATL